MRLRVYEDFIRLADEATDESMDVRARAAARGYDYDDARLVGHEIAETVGTEDPLAPMMFVMGAELGASAALDALKEED
jgi:hypothetical protein